VLSQLVIREDWGKTHTKASKNHNNIAGEEWLAHIRTIVVSLGGKLTYLFICLYGIASSKICRDFWSVDLILLLMTLFCCLWPCKTIRACERLILLFIKFLVVFAYI
jgi:hypothetical protein